MEFSDVTLRAIQALIELCTGNLANQQTVLNAQILDTIHDVLVLKVLEVSQNIITRFVSSTEII